MQGPYGYGGHFDAGYPPGPSSNYYGHPQQQMQQADFGQFGGNGGYQQQHQQPTSGFPVDELTMRAPPEVSIDPLAFRRFFMYQLSQLTFNSKPIITGLTLFAHHHVMRMAPIVASCLEEHLRNCPLQMRLPAFYLLDSISKNVGPPYVGLFARFIERAFLSTYQSADPHTQVKLEELLGTWRSGGEDGGELFRFPEEMATMRQGGRVQRGIESVLFGLQGLSARSFHEADSFASGVGSANHAERSETLYDIRRALQTKLDWQQMHPDDPRNSTQVAALQKLESLVLDTKLTSEQIQQIRAQLGQLVPPRQPDTLGIRSPMYGGGSDQQQPRPTTPLNNGGPYIGSPLHSIAQHVTDHSNRPTPPPGALAGTIDTDLLARLKGLASSGGIPGLVVDAAAAGDGPTNAVASVPEAYSTKYEDEACAAFDAAIAALDISLTNADLQRFGSHAVSFLYHRMPLQCNQCGVRFLDSPAGSRNFDKHLDWHFVTKRRIREGAGRAQGRSWFSSETDWLQGDLVADEDSATAGRDGTSQGASSKAGTLAPTIDREQLVKQKVVASQVSGSSSAGSDDSIVCAICQEPFKSEWSDADEEWVYWNAVLVDGKLYHATCHAEAVAARLKIKEEASRASRELTPVVKSPRVGQSAQIKAEDGTTGTTDSARKRKAEELSDDERKPLDEQEDTKRIKAEPQDA